MDTSTVTTSPEEENPLIKSPEELYLLGGDRLEGEKDLGPEFAKSDESLEKLSELTGEAETIERGIEGIFPPNWLRLVMTARR